VEELGDITEALRVLDTTRAKNHSNIEVLFRAAHLNQRLGNNTAALDNLAMILLNGSSRRAIELARDLSEDLGKFDEALKFQLELERKGFETELTATIKARLEHKQIISSAASDDSKQNDLAALAKRHPEYAPALESLADLALSKGNTELCAEYLVKAARAARSDIAKWRRIVDLWLKANQLDQRQRSDKAIAAARSATKETSGEARLEAELLLIETLLATNHFQDAERAIEAFATLIHKEIGAQTDELAQRLTIQRGYCLAQIGKLNTTGTLWQQLAVSGEAARAIQNDSRAAVTGRAEPSPVLSTP
jgi:hypothetical protein